MAEDNNQEPAAADPGVLTESAAADLLQDWREETDQETAPVSSSRIQSNAAEEAKDAAEADPPTEAESEVDAEEADAEDTTSANESDDVYVDGKARTRLRDGTEVTIGELKKSFDEARDFRRQQSEFDARKQELESRTAHYAQQEQNFASTIQQAISALQNTVPPEPDLLLRQNDPIAYAQLKWAREDKLQEIGRLHQAQQSRAEQTQAEQATQFQERLKQEQTRLYERSPELRDEGKRREFFNDLQATARDYGFSKGEIDNIHDHRVMLMVKDAIAYRKLQAAKPKAAEKGKAAKPVAKPGERASSNASVATKHKALFERAQRTRSIDDVGAVLAELE
jgi:hypothetical protein